MAKQSKLIHLDGDVIKSLSIQAINAGSKSLKNYLETILIEHSLKSHKK